MIIFENDNYRLSHFVAKEPGDYTVIFFNHWRAGLDPAALGEPIVEGWYEKTSENNFLTAKNISAIFFQSRINDWFQSEGIIEAMHHIRSMKPAGHKYITYGSSMGGHAAISFFDEIGADFFLAISPQISLSDHYMDSIGDKRWRKVSRIFRYDNILDGKCQSARGIITTDLLYPEDKAHTVDIAKRTNSYVINCPGMWHQSGLAVNREYGLVKLLKEIAQNELESRDSFGVAAQIQAIIDKSEATQLVNSLPSRRLEIIARRGLKDIEKSISFDALAHEFLGAPSWERALLMQMIVRETSNPAQINRLSLLLKNNGFENLAGDLV